MTNELLTLYSNNNEDEAAAWLECASRWLESVERRRGSARSRQEYQKILTAFFGFVGKTPQEVAGVDCQRWATSLQESGLARNTIKTRLAAVSSFYQFASTRYEVEPGRYLHNFNPATTVQRPHVNPYEKSQGLSIEQARAMLLTCKRDTEIGARDYALIVFYLYTGRRRAEIARMTWGDLRPGQEGSDSREYHYEGKGGKTAWRELPQPVWTALEAYLKLAGRLDVMQTDTPLFVATNDHAERLGKPVGARQPIGERTISQIIERAATKAGVEHVKVHALRHTAAKLRRKGGASLEEVSKFLDHSSIATTQIYLNAVEARQDVGWKAVEALLGLPY